MSTVEDIIMRRSSRGMDQLRPHLAADYCRRAASSLLALKRGNVLIATGFYVGGHAETDGPPGAFFVARALNTLGFDCIVITDEYCAGLFQSPASGGISEELVDIRISGDQLNSVLDQYNPSALISIERCGINAEGDYANMRGVSIASHTARLDFLFEQGRRRLIPTFGIGDGGNEIGMGCFKETIERELSLSPCVTEVDFPIIASVSNWGAYGLCACLQKLSGLRVMPSSDELSRYLSHIVPMGCVDGVTGTHTPTVDGYPLAYELETIELLRAQSNS